MKMQSNMLVKLAVPLTLLVTVFIGLKACSSDKAQQQPDTAAKNDATLNDVTPEQLRALGIEGDTPQDTLRTLIGRLNTVTTKQDRLDAENKMLAEENKRLKQTNQNVDERIGQAIANAKTEESSEKSQLKSQVQSLSSTVSDLVQQLKEVGTPGSTSSASSGNHVGPGSDIPIGLGLDGGFTGQVTPSGSSSTDGLRWVEPIDAVAVDASGKPVTEGSSNRAAGFTFATSFLEENPVTRQQAELARQAGNGQTLSGNNASEGPVEPVYTLPENSTLIGSRAMTALLGRVPVDGKVTDPYPFKILIGKDNLTANGIDLPDVQGAIVSGTATGDWTLSCVRGSVSSITFVFSDGTVRTLPRPSGQTEGNNSQNSNNGGSIGWISDENGIPCLSGERKSNASTYLPTLFALSAGSAAGEALAQNQNTTQGNGFGGVTSSLTGDAGQAVMGKAISGGMQETVDWVKARYGQTFDAVYVPPGMKVAVHITRQLAIDYEEKGRKVKYDFNLGQFGTGMD
ncbi:TIGR03752 family integrating conjugative element protein [Pectobacterium actinidiae]|uniref:TIGR03752 family integrating conjugative element protein n=1 Tax=Pectobacterium actinidiae TaxID=1507808 RepID=UPI0038234F11